MRTTRRPSTWAPCRRTPRSSFRHVRLGVRGKAGTPAVTGCSRLRSGLPTHHAHVDKTCALCAACMHAAPDGPPPRPPAPPPPPTPHTHHHHHPTPPHPRCPPRSPLQAAAQKGLDSADRQPTPEQQWWRFGCINSSGSKWRALPTRGESLEFDEDPWVKRLVHVRWLGGQAAALGPLSLYPRVAGAGSVLAVRVLQLCLARVPSSSLMDEALQPARAPVSMLAFIAGQGDGLVPRGTAGKAQRGGGELRKRVQQAEGWQERAEQGHACTCLQPTSN